MRINKDIIIRYSEKFLPWLNTRISYIIIILLEFFIFLNLFNNQYKNLYLLNFSLIIFYSLKILLWIMFSYILGRYTNKYKISFLKKNNINHIIKSFYLITLFSIIDILYFSLFNNEIINQESKIIFFKYNLLFISISIVINLIKNVIEYKFFRRKKQWILLSEDNNIKKEIDIFNNLEQKISFYNYNSIENLEINKYKGIILIDKLNPNLLTKELINRIKNKDIKTISIQKSYYKFMQRIPIEIINDQLGYDIKSNYLKDKKNYNLFLKRIFEFVFSLLLLLISSPLLIIASILIYLEDKGPILYSQYRVGKNNKLFTIWKLRSMRVNAEKDGIKWASKNDKRITKIGKLLRKTRIDELPQLLSVLQGKMNLIGPRPERPEFVELLNEEIKYYSLRALSKPGITGWAQVNYPYGASIYDSKNKLSYDLYYLKHYSLLFDLLIFFKTIRLVINARGSEPNN